MSEDVVRLAANPMTPADRRRLESYGSHVIQHGWATRFAWAEDGGDPRFEIFRGGADETLALRVGRDRARHEFFAEDAQGRRVAAGTIDHLMAELDAHLQDAAEGDAGGAGA